MEKSEWHTCKWYKENFGVDPLKLGLPFKQVPNPYYRRAAPMKLWKETDILPYKSDEGVKKYAERSERGKRAFETKKTHLKEWFTKIKSKDPRVKEIIKRLWEIGEHISFLHEMKEECRSFDDSDSDHHFDFGEEHCDECTKMSMEQEVLREARAGLFSELEKVCGKDKKTIQLARKYLREDQQPMKQKFHGLKNHA